MTPATSRGKLAAVLATGPPDLQTCRQCLDHEPETSSLLVREEKEEFARAPPTWGMWARAAASQTAGDTRQQASSSCKAGLARPRPLSRAARTAARMLLLLTRDSATCILTCRVADVEVRTEDAVGHRL